MKTNWGRRAVVLVAGAILGAAALAPASAATPSPLEIMRSHASRAGTVRAQALSSTAASALTWIEKELTASGHRFQTVIPDVGTFDDVGLTIDGLLALNAGGRGADAEANASSDYVIAHASDYVTGGQFAPTDRYAGALGKLLFLTQVRGLSSTVGSLNLETELRARMQTSGASAGRFSDKSSEFNGSDDFSNGIGDALDVMALAGTANGVPPAALTWLRNQQCPNGGFRSDYQVHLVATETATTNTSCVSNAQADLDATSFAIQALVASDDDSDATSDAAVGGLSYLFAAQDDDGSFNTGNGNSTGLAASVLRGIGDAPDANKAAAFVINTLQLASGADAGAIALNKAGADAAKANGLTPASRETLERATPQAVLALGLPAYIDIGDVTPVEPSTTATLSASSVAIGSPITATGQGFLAGENVNFVLRSDPIGVGSAQASATNIVSLTFNAPAAAGAGAHTLTLTGEVSGATVTVPLTLTAAAPAATTTTVVAPGSTTTTAVRLLARSGDDTGGQSGIAAGLILFGGALVIAARKRRIIYPFKR